ncbi:coproporphyrinogen III oxidase [Sphingomonas sp. CGMCC 1.13654]|uniref:Heme chaperone HemW n=1 Tax=Sphingomonas chungangi TaxID=2683589 RepID=A0A838LD48_9SPHN|nr:radical SAM family heme chaperone HemW [Sphingomonas chungangi]MBA2936056.1 coproporphyrinogen III oxidase [Sphingomonas chungangi]MVW55445.1 coproporphyrinogen III oxidase [Sphingomonas chungangi]
MSVGDPLALYVHWPFCISKCPYCDFNSHVRAEIDEAAWRDSLLADLAHEAALTAERPLGSIFFGGGTPSLMAPATVEAVLNAAEHHWGFAPGIEITLEANPSSVEAANFQALASAGVNRVSLGLQALDDDALRFLGRAHGVAESLAALDTAQAAFDRVSIDLIYARPDQTEAQWLAELYRALGFGTEHLSLYQLTIEPGTRFAALVAKGELPTLGPDEAAHLFEITRTVTAEAGIPAYEISNHARPGAESRHNLAYWRYRDYLGVGPGAHGRRGRAASLRRKKPENWLAAVARNGHGIESEEALDGATRAEEALLMGLRLDEGVDLAWIATETGLAIDAIVNEAAIDRLSTHGLLKREGDHLLVREAGMLLLDGILVEIVR